MRETLSKGHKGKTKSKVAAARVSSKLVSKKKKELKKKPATSQSVSGSSRATSRLKQGKISPAKIAKSVRSKKAVKKLAKASVKKTTPKPASKPERSEKKIVVQKKVVQKKRIKNQSLGGLSVIISQAPPPPTHPRRQVTSNALRDFEQGVDVFNRRRFEEAKTMFESVLAKYPGDLEVVARSQMYIQVCKQKMESGTETGSLPLRNADELYHQGVFSLNIGDFTQARVFFENALSLRPNEPHLLYSLAATHARTGSHEEALDYLKRSIQVQPRFRAQAYNDTDFSELRDNRRFLELIGLTSPFDLLESRR